MSRNSQKINPVSIRSSAAEYLTIQLLSNT